TRFSRDWSSDVCSSDLLLEPRLGFLVTGVAIGVVFHRRAAIGLLQLVHAGGAADTQDFVVVALAHQSGPSCGRTRKPWSTCAAGTGGHMPAVPVTAADGRSVLLPVVVLDLGELGVHHVIGLCAGFLASGARPGFTGLPRCRSRGE